MTAGHFGDAAALASRITENFGQAYDPKQRKQLRAKLLRLLTQELSYVSNDVVVRALDNALKIRVTLDWHRFLCIIFCPGAGSSSQIIPDLAPAQCCYSQMAR